MGGEHTVPEDLQSDFDGGVFRCRQPIELGADFPPLNLRKTQLRSDPVLVHASPVVVERTAPAAHVEGEMLGQPCCFPERMSDEPQHWALRS